MKLNKLVRIGDAVEVIANETDCTIGEIVEPLIGYAWDEEDAGMIMDYHADESDL